MLADPTGFTKVESPFFQSYEKPLNLLSGILPNRFQVIKGIVFAKTCQLQFSVWLGGEYDFRHYRFASSSTGREATINSFLFFTKWSDRGSPSGSWLWQVNRGSDNGIVINTQINKIVHNLDDVDGSPDILDFSPDGKYAFITLR